MAWRKSVRLYKDRDGMVRRLNMQRMDHDAHPRTALTWKPDGRRKRERPHEVSCDYA